MRARKTDTRFHEAQMFPFHIFVFLSDLLFFTAPRDDLAPSPFKAFKGRGAVMTSYSDGDGQ